MLPEGLDVILDDEVEDEYLIIPSLTYRLDLKNKRIMGMIDEQQAVIQFIGKVLSINKYAYEIYDWYYGNEVDNLIGMPYAYVEAELPRIIKENLLADDRINEVTDFVVKKVSIDSCRVSFKVNSIYGSIAYSTEVEI